MLKKTIEDCVYSAVDRMRSPLFFVLISALLIFHWDVIIYLVASDDDIHMRLKNARVMFENNGIVIPLFVSVFLVFLAPLFSYVFQKYYSSIINKNINDSYDSEILMSEKREKIEKIRAKLNIQPELVRREHEEGMENIKSQLRKQSSQIDALNTANRLLEKVKKDDADIVAKMKLEITQLYATSGKLNEELNKKQAEINDMNNELKETLNYNTKLINEKNSIEISYKQASDKLKKVEDGFRGVFEFLENSNLAGVYSLYKDLNDFNKINYYGELEKLVPKENILSLSGKLLVESEWRKSDSGKNVKN